MDRTCIAPWKAEEKEQSERLYRKLQGLALVHPMTDEMKKLLIWDMFLKPNHAAFFHVMHYLFRLLDPAEFKRRFFWPLTDKKSEANFRSSTVEYLKHLNEKHQLQWTNIKSYLVVMPGGMRFINFLLEFVGFVIRELTKQREKSLGDSDVQNADVKVMARQNAVMKDYASDYVANLEENMALLKHNTQRIRQTIEALAKEAGIPEELLLDDNFLEEFEASNRRTLEQKISQPAAGDVQLEESLCGLKEDLEKFQAKQSEHNQRKEAVDSVLNGFRGIFGSETFTEEDFDDPLIGSKIESMVRAFNQVSSTVAEQLDANDHYNESNEFVTTDLQALRVEVAQIESQLTNVQKDLNAQLHQIRERKEAEEKSSAQLQPPTTPRLESRFQDIASKFVSTPPIRIDLAGATGSSAPVRLALQDDYNAKQFDAFSNSLLAPAPPRSARKPKGLDQSAMDLNGTMNRSKINDPMELLRTIHKNTNKAKNAPQANISSLGSKWKQMQASFGFDEPAATSPQKSSADSRSPFTPLSGSECTRVERVVAETNNSLMAKSAAVMKVLKDASLSFQNLSTSPSGRLDALVAGPPTDFQLELTPRLQVNDVTILESQAFKPDPGKENDANVPNLSLFDFNKNGDDDDLQNISDSILKDITM
ncbi:uncharacterized protein Dana_GF22941 [Drosophila ananassae]|uniref:HAUS augmin-like complex subunit 6 N-terminal domain-containing protein n=1 Tax=Drosophila ananassae TaxID=7217 RepID=B3MT45_DROAN|nr:augmin complex subunit dgt6 [Drosophila ananassae]EDV30435.1 uncharacterized protein Dana_GF22941 [Drosophila ananassae]